MSALQSIVRSLESGETKNVLFVRPGRVGDLLFTTPLLRRFKERYPHVAISLLVSTYSKSVLRYNPLIDGILSFDPKVPRLRRWLELRRMEREVRKHSFDLAVLLSRKGKERKRLKRAGIRHLFQHSEDPNKPDGKSHIIEQLLRALAPLGINGPPGPLEIYFSPKEEQEVGAFLQRYEISRQEKFAVLHPGCFQIHSHKLQTFSARRLWPLENFQELAERLYRQLGVKIVLSGSGPEEGRIIDRLASQLTIPVALGTELGITQLAALLDRASLLVSVDTGPMHIGAARETPLIALFGPSPVYFTRPWGPGKMTILWKDIPCSPCRGKGISCFNNICMKDITVDEVFQAAQKLLILS